MNKGNRILYSTVVMAACTFLSGGLSHIGYSGFAQSFGSLAAVATTITLFSYLTDEDVCEPE